MTTLGALPYHPRRDIRLALALGAVRKPRMLGLPHVSHGSRPHGPLYLLARTVMMMHG